MGDRVVGRRVSEPNNICKPKRSTSSKERKEGRDDDEELKPLRFWEDGGVVLVKVFIQSRRVDRVFCEDNGDYVSVVASTVDDASSSVDLNWRIIPRNTLYAYYSRRGPHRKVH